MAMCTALKFIVVGKGGGYLGSQEFSRRGKFAILIRFGVLREFSGNWFCLIIGVSNMRSELFLLKCK